MSKQTKSQWGFGGLLLAEMSMNLVAVPRGGISPRTLSWVKISADSRRRLQFKGAAFCFS
jgi:hypothetical protein